jgi:pyruvate formate lyase activating enzyme
VNDPRVKEALLYERLDGSVRCTTCERRCVVEPGDTGFCGTRKNIDGRLNTLVYGDISAVAVHPIEHKPLFHFYPGSRALTVSTWSCNFECGWCFRKYLSRGVERVGQGQFVLPEGALDLLRRHDCHGLAVSFNEPTLLFEWCLDVFPLLKLEGYYTCIITNGYMNLEALRLLAERGLDAVKIDIKGDRDTVQRHCGADVEKVWRNAVESKRLGLWVEIVTLVIPRVTDSEQCLRGIASRIREDLGVDTPWHVNAYIPRDEHAFKFYGQPAPVEVVSGAREIGFGENLHYVYAGGYPGPFQNTLCPSCGELLVERHGFGFDFFEYRMGPDKRCPKCGTEIPIVGEPVIAQETGRSFRWNP